MFSQRKRIETKQRDIPISFIIEENVSGCLFCSQCCSRFFFRSFDCMLY